MDYLESFGNLTRNYARLTYMAIRYEIPLRWIEYDLRAIVSELVDAKSAVLSLTTAPYQRDWVEKLQQIQLKMEIAGTSRIEGADFAETELEEALDPSATLVTRSQRQARSAVETYRWIAALAPDRPVDTNLITEVHRRIVTGCDDDHCPPGRLRDRDQNVTFGTPRHRGCEGGEECRVAFDKLVAAIRTDFRRHDLLIQALALHYHLGAMHPFLDGNGRTARAVEALLLQRAGLRDTAFIAMSNYYYEEKQQYLDVLAHVRGGYDLTPFLKFGLRGIAIQCKRQFKAIRVNVKKALFRNRMYDLFNRLVSPRTRVMKERQIRILQILLEEEELDWDRFLGRAWGVYAGLRAPDKAFTKDINRLLGLDAIKITEQGANIWKVSVNLEWPAEITESDFFSRIKQMPKGKTYKFLR